MKERASNGFHSKMKGKIDPFKVLCQVPESRSSCFIPGSLLIAEVTLPCIVLAGFLCEVGCAPVFGMWKQQMLSGIKDW